MASKPNIAYVRGYLTEPRQYPPHLQQDLSQLRTNCSAVLDWAEDLEQQLSATRTTLERTIAERAALRREYAELAGRSTTANLTRLQEELDEARREIETARHQMDGQTADSAAAVSALDRVLALLDESDRRTGNASSTTFVLVSDLRAAIEEKDTV